MDDTGSFGWEYLSDRPRTAQFLEGALEGLLGSLGRGPHHAADVSETMLPGDAGGDGTVKKRRVLDAPLAPHVLTRDARERDVTVWTLLGQVDAGFSAKIHP